MTNMNRILAIILFLPLALFGQTRLTIGVGNSANDGTGDSLRTAMQKANTNFSTLWATVYTNGVGKLGTSIPLIGNTVIDGGAPTYDFTIQDVDDLSIEGTDTSLTGIATMYLDGADFTTRATTAYKLISPIVYNGNGVAGGALELVDATEGNADFKVNRVATVAALKALPASAYQNAAVVTTLGYHSAGDGGGGVYRYDAASSETANDGTVITPSHGAGRFLIQAGPFVTAKQFGAIGNGTTDDTSRVSAALTWAAANATPLEFGPGEYLVTGGSLSVTNVALRFSGGVLRITNSTLSITAPITAPHQRIFRSALTTPVRFARASGGYIGPSTGASHDRVSAEWFGAAGDASTDNATSLQQWLNAVGNGMVATMAGGNYYTTSGITWPSGMRFVRVEGNGSRITYNGSTNASAGVLQMTNAGNILTYRCEITGLTFDANNLAGYAVLAKSSGGSFSINTLRWHECSFVQATAANVLAGDYTFSNNDCDFASWEFNRCLFYGGNGSVNLVIDAPNAVNVRLGNCVLGAVSPSSNRPANNARLLSGANVTFDTCFFDRIQAGNFCIVNRGLIATFNGCDSETTRFLWQEASSSLANLASNIRTLRLSNAGSENASGTYAIWALAGTVVLDGSPLVSGSSVYNVRCDGRLVSNGTWIGGSLSGSTTSSADITTPVYCALTMDGKRADDVAYLNSNRYFDLWSGSASGDLPLGYSASASGTATIIRAGSVAADYPKNNYGRYCAKITTAVGATSGHVLDGIFVRAASQARRGAGPYVAMVSGFIEAATGSTAPTVSIATYTWSGAAWTVANSQVRVCSVDSSGRFWGVATVSQAPSSLQSGFVEAYCGMGSGNTGIIYLSEFAIMRGDGATLADLPNGVYPDFGRLKAFSVVPKSATLNGSFSDGSWWSLGTGWAVSSGSAAHTSGTSVLSQDIGLTPRQRRMLLSFRVNGMTAGSVTPRVAGTSGNAVQNSSASTQVTFTTTGVGVVPTAGATYTVGGVTYTVDWATATQIRATGGVPTTTSGTLTKSAGTGDASISFTAINATQIVEIIGGTGLKAVFTTRGVTTPPAVGDTYTVGGVTYTITASSATSITATATTTAIPSLGPSTMTRTSGSGDASITYQYAVATAMLEFVPSNDFNGSVTAVQLQFPVVCGSDAGPEDYIRAGQMPLTTAGLSVGASENLQPPVITQGSAAPTVGTWRAGSIVYNSAPAVGQPTYWVCTATGTPGTWVAGPNL